jgi:threonine/homoserine/homoserine lactone efflux protein
MTPELLAALAAFAFVSSITPGPNNLMLMASGANYGYTRTIPHMLGVALGFTLMVTLVGIGLMQVFDRYPITYDLLRVCSVLYLLYLAWRIATAAAPHAGEPARGRPFTFLQAAAFQWVNPKAWTMALTAISVYAPSHSLYASVWVAVVFGAVNLPCINVWTVLGIQLRRLLNNPMRLRVFNIGMALLLVGSLYPVLAPLR